MKDSKEWQEWVEQCRADITRLARQDAAEKLINKVKHNAPQAPSGQLVEEVFEQLGLPLTEELKKEVRGRNKAVHEARMYQRGPDVDFGRQVERIAMVRTLLVALVAKTIGYDGPLLGWALDSHRVTLTAPADWWRPAQHELDDVFEAARSTDSSASDSST